MSDEDDTTLFTWTRIDRREGNTFVLTHAHVTFRSGVKR